jgi:hypothetical protein
MSKPAKHETGPDEQTLRNDTAESRSPAAPAERKTAMIAVRVGAFVYTGEYNTSNDAGYIAGDLHKGQPIEIRFDQEKMYIELPDGRELETKIVRKVEQPGEARFTPYPN